MSAVSRITCRKCGQRVKDTFGEKLSHVLTQHSDVMIEEAVRSGGESIREKSFNLGVALRERFIRTGETK